MKFFIPQLRDSFILEKDWKFSLYVEYRNRSLYEYLFENFFSYDSHYKWHEFDEKIECRMQELLFLPYKMATIKSGTELVVKRISIQNKSNKSYDFANKYFNNHYDYNTMAFVVKNASDHNLIGQQFWAKLLDVATIEFDPSSITKNNPINFKYKSPELIKKEQQINARKEELKWIRNSIHEKVHNDQKFWKEIEHAISGYLKTEEGKILDDRRKEWPQYLDRFRSSIDYLTHFVQNIKNWNATKAVKYGNHYSRKFLIKTFYNYNSTVMKFLVVYEPHKEIVDIQII